MELPKFGKAAQGRFEGLKSKLGFGGTRQADQHDEQYEEYENDYHDQGGYDDHYDDYGNDGAAGGYGSGNSPRLVSKEDVRANTRYAQNASGSGYATGIGSKRKIERASDYMLSTNTSDLSYGADQDQLYTPTRPGAPENSAAAPVLRTARSAFEPQENYGGGVMPVGPSRNMAILRPTSYSEAERVANALKAGEVVVLCLQKTPSDLMKRILDFSFGVSHAMDANVDCIADKVFVIIRGRALSDDELAYLRTQGVF